MDTSENVCNTDQEEIDELEDKLDILTFDGNAVNHLQLITNVPEPVFKDFCRLALDYLLNGHNEKRYNIAAEKLNTTSSSIQNAVNALVYLLINGCKYNLNEKDFAATLTQLSLSQENKSNLVKFFNAKKENVRRGMMRFNVDLPMFNNLDWRLEAQVASQSLPDCVIPSVLLDFTFKNFKSISNGECVDSDIITHEVLQCDLPNLDNLISNLETALRETKYHHAKQVKTAMTKE